MDKRDARAALAKRLRTARHKAGYGSAARAADVLQIAYPTYAGYENGSRGVSPELVLRMAELFGVAPTWLQYGLHDAVTPETRPGPPSEAVPDGVLARLVAERADAAERMERARREVAALDAAIAMLGPGEAA